MALYTISFSKVQCWNRCRRAWYYRYQLELQRKLKAIPLALGSLGHKCLELYYSNDCKLKATLPALKEFKRDIKGLFDEERALYEDMPKDLMRILRGYHIYWQDHKNLKVVTADGRPFVERRIFYPLTDMIDLELVVDLVAETNNGLWVIDHKFVKSLPTESYRTTDMQTALYYFIIKELTGLPIDGAMFNYLKSTPRKKPRVLKSGKLSKAKIDTDPLTFMEAIQENKEDAKEYEEILATLKFSNFYQRYAVAKPDVLVKTLLHEMVQAGKHMYAIQNSPASFFPHNLTSTCDWDCEYRPLCIAELMGHDTEFMIKTNYERRKREDGEETEEEAAGN